MKIIYRILLCVILCAISANFHAIDVPFLALSKSLQSLVNVYQIRNSSKNLSLQEYKSLETQVSSTDFRIHFNTPDKVGGIPLAYVLKEKDTVEKDALMAYVLEKTEAYFLTADLNTVQDKSVYYDLTNYLHNKLNQKNTQVFNILAKNKHFLFYLAPDKKDLLALIITAMECSFIHNNNLIERAKDLKRTDIENLLRKKCGDARESLDKDAVQKNSNVSLVIPEKFKSVLKDVAYGMRQGNGVSQNNRIVYKDFSTNDNRLIFSLFDGFNGAYVADLLASKGPQLLNNDTFYTREKTLKQNLIARQVFHNLQNDLKNDSQALLQGAFIACAVVQGVDLWLVDLSLYPCIVYANGSAMSREVLEKKDKSSFQTVTPYYKETTDNKGFSVPYLDQDTVKYFDMYKHVFGFPGYFFTSEASTRNFSPGKSQGISFSFLTQSLVNLQQYDLSSNATEPISVVVLSNNAVQQVLSNEDIAFVIKGGLAAGKNAQALVSDILDKAQKMTQESVACIVLCTQNILQNSGFSSEKYPTFTSWYDACKKLPLNRVKTASGRGGHSEKDYKDTAIYLADFERLLINFCMLSSDVLDDSKTWFNHQKPPSGFYSDCAFPYGFFLNKDFDIARGKDELIQPFVEHVVVDNTSKIAFHGDFHGDIHSLIEYLNYLKSIKFIDDSFKIIEPQGYMVFLGDYTDRGMYGMEVIYTVMRLKLANPERVILVRGNHEDIMQTQQDGFVSEIEFKTKKLFKDDTDAWRKLCNKIHKIYDFMPVAVYLGTTTDVLQCCHGGMEIGYDPQDFLQSTARYALLHDLKRKTHIDTMNVGDLFYDLDTNFYTDVESINSYSVLGFMWSDFNVGHDELASYRHGRGLQYSKDLTYKILEFYNQQTVKVRGVFRAHQHDGGVMMRSILHSGGEKYKGLSLLWEKDVYITQQYINTSLPLWQGIVATFNVGPDSWMGAYMKYSYDTFGILKIAQKFEEWRLQVINQEIVIK